MVEQENALYQGELWCVYELKDDKGHYKEDLRLKMRMASQAHELICPVCKQPIILCAGMIREPYLRHHCDSNCSVRTNGNGGDHAVARRMMYQLAKRSFHDATVICSNMMGSFVADICVMFNQCILVMEYLSYDMKLSDWLDKHAFYEQQGIVDIWFLNSKKYCFEAPTTFEYLISTKKNTLYILDTQKEEVTLKRILRLPGHSSGHVVDRTYFLPDLQLDIMGGFLCDFDEYFAQELEEETQLDVKRQEKYPMGLRKALALKKAQEDSVREINQKNCENNQPQERNNKEIQEQYKSDQVYRLPLRNTEFNSLIMKLPAINECWRIPKLRGEARCIELGNKERFDYLHELNDRLMIVEDEDMKEQMIEEAIYYLEEMIEAKRWI